MHKEGGAIFRDRVMGVLGITRALGDIPLKKEGVVGISARPYVGSVRLQVRCGDAAVTLRSSEQVVGVSPSSPILGRARHLPWQENFAGALYSRDSVHCSVSVGNSDKGHFCIAFLELRKAENERTSSIASKKE